MGAGTDTEGGAAAPAPGVAGRGRLAQVIATRGGTAAPEAPFVIENREALIYMLCEAAELEHAIMCQYLFAAFTLKRHADEGLTPDELAAVSRWRKQIAHVATQEMLHLALVQNLLSAIGAAPHMSRVNLPAQASHYPAGVQLALLPFGEEALRHFMFLERPEHMELEDAAGLVAFGAAAPKMAEYDIVPQLQDFATVGHLYRSIEAGLGHLAEKFGERALFVGPARAQATSAQFRWPELIAVTDLASACRAIEEILEQGEGPRGDWQNAHFGQFVNILDEFQAMSAANPAFEPTRNVVVANVRSHEHVDVPLVTDLLSAHCMDLFNVSYEVLLQAFERYFAHTEETDEQLSTLADLTLGLMFNVLDPLGDLVTRLPAGPEYPGRMAGPSFELFYETDDLMPHRGAAWALLEERLRDAAAYANRICTAHAQDTPFVAQAVAPVAAALSRLADSLAAHFPEWGATSRFSASAIDSAAGSAGSIGLAGSAGDPAVGRLLARARELAIHLGPDLAARVDALADGTPSADAAWNLASDAARLRAADGATGGLIEATAILQDLASRLAPDQGPDSAKIRLAELRSIQAGLAPGITVAADGPYLVTNAENLRNWLGEGVAARPQMALCRCGGSSTKPFCDGTHASNGFSGAKSAKRVPDRSDTYPGEQVTIFDNRGICQHAGLCTDRLASVFHAGSEPFVTPSGGRMDEIVRVVRSCPSGALSFGFDGGESRDIVDRHGTREAAIEVSLDGPYRVTGGLPLADADGNDVPRADGSSREHYALCRCGHSVNKPFCSGMHWYVDFADPARAARPSPFEYAGGLPALQRMTSLFFGRYAPEDPAFAALYASAPPDQAQQAALRLAAALGVDPNTLTANTPEPSADATSAARGANAGSVSRAAGSVGGAAGSVGGTAGSVGGAAGDGVLSNGGALVGALVGGGVSEADRGRWIGLWLRCADEAGLPAESRFRSVFAACVAWESASDSGEVRQWDWGEAGPPPADAAIAVSAGSSASAPGTATSDASAHVHAVGASVPGQAPSPSDGPSSDRAASDRAASGSASSDRAASDTAAADRAAPAPSHAVPSPIVLPAQGEPVSFALHIRPLFRDRDRDSMSFAFDLWSYDDVQLNAAGILERLRDGSMPCDGVWPADRIDVFQRWLDSGTPR